MVASAWASPSCPASSTGQAVANELLSDNVYDYRNRLVAVRSYSGGALGDQTEYRYDPLSRPTRKIATESGATTTMDMQYLGDTDVVARETETGAMARTRWYAFDATGQRATLAETVSGATSRFSYLTDPHGSVEALLDNVNTVKAGYGYLAYGEANPSLTKTAGGFTPNTNLYRYTGRRWDPAAKAYDMGARSYFPTVGRWFQQDAYADAFDDVGLSLDPLTANRYAFTGGNPVNYVELDGHGAAPPCALAKDRRKCRAAISAGATIFDAALVVAPFVPVVGTGLSLAAAARCVVRGNAACAAMGIVDAAGGKYAKLAKLGRTTKAAKETDEGIVYLRADKLGGKPYVGQSKSAARYEARQVEHARENPFADFEFSIVGRAKPGTELDRLEEYFIRRLGGPTTRRNPAGALANRRHQRSKRHYLEAGGAP